MKKYEDTFKDNVRLVSFVGYIPFTVSSNGEEVAISCVF